MDFRVTEYKMFIDVMLDSTVPPAFKRLSLVKFQNDIKEYPFFFPFYCILSFVVYVQNMQDSCIGTHVALCFAAFLPFTHIWHFSPCYPSPAPLPTVPPLFPPIDPSV